LSLHSTTFAYQASSALLGFWNQCQTARLF